MPAQPASRTGGAPESQGQVTALELHLRSLEQGDLISLGGIAIVGTTSSEVTGSKTRKKANGVDVTSVTLEIESGWYAVLSQDCDIVLPPALEPVIIVAPVLYVPQDEWLALRRGMLSYRRYSLDRSSPRLSRF